MAFILSGTTLTESGTVTEVVLPAGTHTQIDNDLLILDPGLDMNITGSLIDESGLFNLHIRYDSLLQVSGVLRVGKREVVNGNPIFSGGGSIKVHPLTSNSSGIRDTIGSTVGEVSFYGSNLNIDTPENGGASYFFCNIGGSSILSQQQD